MAKKTITKEHPITAFRKANEARDVVVKSSMKKMQDGGRTTVKPTADSTLYYHNKVKDEFKKQADLVRKTRNTGISLDDVYKSKSFQESEKRRLAERDNQIRQSKKGKPGYDKNGFPIKKK